MSAKRKFRRTALRVVTSDEAAFRETLALCEALLQLGFELNSLQPGFVPNPRAVHRAVSPIVIVHQGENTLSYRLDNHELEGNQEIVEKRWRAWVAGLLGPYGDVPRTTTFNMYRDSRFGTPRGLMLLRQALRSAKIVIPSEAPTDEPG